MLDVNLVGETLSLLPQRAIFWHRKSMLILADLHLGKAATFRRAGIPVPEATTETNLRLLTDLVQIHRVKRLMILGDFFHSKLGRTKEVLELFSGWRSSHANVRIDLVMGNHDRQAGVPPVDWNFHVHSEPMLVSPFRMCHEPTTVDNAYSLAGHLHPVIRIRDLGQSLRLPVFAVGSQLAILPAFGDFTGSAIVSAQEYAAVYAIADDQVFAIPSGVVTTTPTPRRRSVSS